MEYPHWLMVARAVLVAFGFVSFNTAEKWSQDVSEDIAHELRRAVIYKCGESPASSLSNPAAAGKGIAETPRSPAICGAEPCHLHLG
jgi:hypothetical protein